MSKANQTGKKIRVRFFFFNDTATTEIYTLSLHDALPIWPLPASATRSAEPPRYTATPALPERPAASDQKSPHRLDRKSTRLNSSHSQISYAVFCLKKKTHPQQTNHAADGTATPRSAEVPV